MNLVTPKAAPKQEHLFNKPASVAKIYFNGLDVGLLNN
jgi:hypothetical protein